MSALDEFPPGLVNIVPAEPAGDGSHHRRVLVPVDLVSHATNALTLGVRLGQASGGIVRLIHTRPWDPPTPVSGGRFYPETAEEATQVLDDAMQFVWSQGVEATGVVIDVERACMAGAILNEAASWSADIIVLTARPPRWFTLGLWDPVARQIMHGAECSVLVVHPSHS